MSISYTFSGTAPPPTQTSLIGFYTLDESAPLKSVASVSVCSKYTLYNARVNGGLCPPSGTLKLSPPATPGQYKIVLAPWSPVNEFGMQGCVSDLYSEWLYRHAMT